MSSLTPEEQEGFEVFKRVVELGKFSMENSPNPEDAIIVALIYARMQSYQSVRNSSLFDAALRETAEVDVNEMVDVLEAAIKEKYRD